MTYHDTLDYIFSFANFHISASNTFLPKTFDLGRMERLLDALGNPHRKFQSVHIAGTKGKGSTAAIIESVLRTAGHCTGFYTSPHLHTFRERIRVAGAMISQADVIAGVDKLKPIVGEIPNITTFEIITALAFDYFAQREIEMAVLEVGLGGRLDATNVVTPLVSVITSLSYDHMAILGNTLAEIAREKAGIIKPNTPAVSAPQAEEAMRVIEQTAQEKNAPLIMISPKLEFQVSGFKFQVKPLQRSLQAQTFALDARNLKPETFNLKLLGKHQLTNAATALATLCILREKDIAIPDGAIRDGLANVEWHGRFEILAREPSIVVDGAHNADSARQLIATLHDYFTNSRLHFVFGSSSDKDIAGMFAEILPHAASLTITRSRNPRAADPAQLVELARQYQIETTIEPELAAALEARRRINQSDVLCVTGSLFVVAEAREFILAECGIALEKDF